MIPASAQALLLLPLLVSPALAVHTATSPRTQDGVVGTRELFQLEERRQRELNEAASELQRELFSVRQDSAEARDKTADLLDRHYEKLAELEREFAEKRDELLQGRFGRSGADGSQSRRSEVLRELAALEAERARELRQVDEELERELGTAREEARGEDKPEKYREKARRLRARHFEKVSQIEHRFAEKRAHVLRKSN